jgi:multiple antibiotic resistance protein
MQLLLTTAITIFFLMDFIGTIPVFISLTASKSHKEKMRIAILSSIVAGLLVLLFALLGQSILHRFDLSLEALRVGGGLLLMYIAFEMIFAGQTIYEKSTDTTNIIVSPLAIPMLAGPGSMSFAMILYVGANSIDKILILLAIVLATIVGALVLTFSVYLSKLLGREPIRGIEKVTAILMAVIASQMIMSGIKGYFF